MEQKLLLIAADTILITHVIFVVFVVLGLVSIYVGYFLKWPWVRNWWFRVSHLVAIAIVVLQSWVGMICPLTTWEMYLRKAADDVVYSGSFIQHWLHSILYYNAPEWVFILCYTFFGCLVLASWFIVNPIRHPDNKSSSC